MEKNHKNFSKKPLLQYREEELAQMKLNIFENNLGFQ